MFPPLRSALLTEQVDAILFVGILAFNEFFSLRPRRIAIFTRHRCVFSPCARAPRPLGAVILIEWTDSPELQRKHRQLPLTAAFWVEETQHP